MRVASVQVVRVPRVNCASETPRGGSEGQVRVRVVVVEVVLDTRDGGWGPSGWSRERSEGRGSAGEGEGAEGISMSDIKEKRKQRNGREIKQRREQLESDTTGCRLMVEGRGEGVRRRREEGEGRGTRLPNSEHSNWAFP